MDLSPTVSTGLQLLQDTTKIPKEHFNKILDLTFQNATAEDQNQIPNEKLSLADVKGLGSSVDVVALKAVHCALTTLIYEAAKTDTTPDQFSSNLEDAKVPEDRIKAITSLFSKCKGIIRRVLSRTSIGFPQLLGLEWRVDHHMRSRALDQVGQPVYLVKLRLGNVDGGESIVEMSCNHQELSDLHARLKSATSRVEALVKKGGRKG
mmetsp:Transcript_4199/g.7671  ORF Transcript_4199/g.7671 Transcript_4199/m.7671 type:complete len:207 (-) Transcript_4199:178-798(-)